MMGRTHSASGAVVWLAGCAAAPMVDVHPTLSAVVAGAVVASGAALLNDIDHRSSRAARCVGPFTYVIACVVARACAHIHAATRTPLDRPDFDGHRTVTHSAVFCLAAGGLVSAALLLAGQRWRALAPVAWLGFPVVVGSLTHCLGDALTNSGCPILWPVRIAGRRWYPVGPPRRFRFPTNGRVERWLVMPVLLLAGLGVAWALLAAPVP